VFIVSSLSEIRSGLKSLLPSTETDRSPSSIAKADSWRLQYTTTSERLPIRDQPGLRGGERLGFASLDELFGFLRRRTAEEEKAEEKQEDCGRQRSNSRVP
jgi:hypothetical protein